MSDKKSIIDSPIAKWVELFIAIAGLAWGFYGNFHSKNPKLIYEILSQATLFNKTEELSSVRLLVDTVDVLTSNQNVSIYTIKVSNVGELSLRSADYDDGVFGIRVNDGVILNDVSINEASNQHIKERYADFSPSTFKQFFDIPRISLDKEEWYTVSVAVLHDNFSKPSFLPVGKVLGQREIRVVLASDEKPSFWRQVFVGGWMVNIVRLLIFVLIGILLIAFVAGITMGISEWLDNRKRERVKNSIASNSNIAAFIRDDYLSSEDDFVRMAEHYYNLGDKKLNKIYNQAGQYLADIRNLNDDSYDRYLSIYRDINRLMAKGYLLKGDDESVTIPREIKESVTMVLDILEKEKYHSYRRRVFGEFYSGIDFLDEEASNKA